MAPNYETHDPKGWCGDPKRGAALGRAFYHIEPAFAGKGYCGRLYLSKVRINQGGYDRLGTYWGIGGPLYWCANKDLSVDYCFRASTREEALKLVGQKYPNAKVRK